MLSMDTSARAWLVKTAVKNYWRVAAWLELDDLIQDGYLHFQRIVVKYPNVTDKPHLMSLFKITYINHIHDLSKKRTRTPEVRCKDDIGEVLTNRLSEPELASFRAYISKAPKPVLDVVNLLTNEYTRQELRAAYGKRKDGTRETVNERLCRLTGYPTTMDLAGLVRSYLSTV